MSERHWEEFRRPHKVRPDDIAAHLRLLTDLRDSGATYDEIAVIFGYKSASSARASHFKIRNHVLNSPRATP